MGKKTIKVYRHWDVLLHKTDVLPEWKLNKSKDNVLVSGEVTWHHHRVGAGATVELLEWEQTEDNNYFRGVVTVKRKPVKITHEEHNEIELKPWKYTAYVQREYDLLENRRVVD